jgi:hypothetical protein
MAKETPPAPATPGKKELKWWCNFCDFRTDDEREYLAHSCQEVLKRQGKTVEASGKSACG